MGYLTSEFKRSSLMTLLALFFNEEQKGFIQLLLICGNVIFICAYEISRKLFTIPYSSKSIFCHKWFELADLLTCWWLFSPSLSFSRVALVVDHMKRLLCRRLRIFFSLMITRSEKMSCKDFYIVKLMT